ncbi:MAG: hypothetical protein ACI9SP_002701 [Arenicella sp.]|jgi:hypothetical protein
MNSFIKLTFFLTLSSATLGFASAQSSMSADQKMAAIDSLRAYEAYTLQPKVEHSTTVKDSSGAALAGAAPKPRYPIPQQTAKTKVLPFVCDGEGENSCELQAFMHEMENRQEPVLIADGKVKVSIYFKNDNNFPDKYPEQQQFKFYPKAQADEQRNRIYEHYLGADYSSYSPDLLGIDIRVAGIAIFVTSSNELMRFIDDSRVTSMRHLGNSQLEEAPR